MANGKELAPYNEKAISLKRYLNSEGIKAQIMAAAPKMLNAERFLKVFYGAILRNPKLVECTTESMLQAAMFFSQLGLEPILGRAYLVPYLNSKQVDGRWVKQYEVQPQVGYQGFVDLGRRSGLILDVWGSCVYENDIFDLSYGMERTLVHKPWFMDPEKRKAGQPGEFIGAYVVWKLKDGTMHPDFMPAFEIHKRRAKSQSYTWAETGDPNKGGGKQDSVWHQWPEEMALKTVIKHSAKLVPASIEFMQAVEFDDTKDNGAGYSPLTNYEFGDSPAKLQAPAADFDTLAKERLMSWPSESWDNFVAATASGNNMTVEEFKRKVAGDGRFADLWAAYERSFGFQPKAPQQAAPAPQAPPAAAPAPQAEANNTPPAAPWARKNWINLRGPGYAAYVKTHIEAFMAAPADVLSEARGKWLNVYKGEEPWPLDPQAPPPPPAQPAPPQAASNQDPESSELQKLKAMIADYEARHPLYVKQARANLRISAEDTLDAANTVLAEIENILERHPPVE
jgi:recombination protein RecT